MSQRGKLHLNTETLKHRLCTKFPPKRTIKIKGVEIASKLLDEVIPTRLAVLMSLIPRWENQNRITLMALILMPSTLQFLFQPVTFTVILREWTEEHLLFIFTSYVCLPCTQTPATTWSAIHGELGSIPWSPPQKQQAKPRDNSCVSG